MRGEKKEKLYQYDRASLMTFSLLRLCDEGNMKKNINLTIAISLILSGLIIGKAYAADNRTIPQKHYLKIHTTIGIIFIPAALSGCFCTTTSKDFAGLRYNPPVPYCKRHVTMYEKNEIAGLYDIKPQQYKYYEFDHLIPLSIGGSNNTCNIWPQPLWQARIKDKLELQLYYAIKAGKITRSKAVKIISYWFHHPCAGLNNHNLCR
jgi:hypothetical protein